MNNLKFQGFRPADKTWMQLSKKEQGSSKIEEKKS